MALAIMSPRRYSFVEPHIRQQSAREVLLRVIALISPKGGAGKTTAALVLALGLAERDERVALIDSDPNRPLVHWSSLPNRPQRVTVHPAPTVQDIRDAERDARRYEPDWIILDTEGSVRGAMAFTTLRPDLAITPLAGSQLEALQALKAAEMVRAFGQRGGSPLPHRCLLTRIPAAIRPRSIKTVVEQLREHQVELLPTALLEKEAFRALFAVGGDFVSLEASGVGGVETARANARAYVDAVLEVMAGRGSTKAA
jgi:chromosome partitioning protein